MSRKIRVNLYDFELKGALTLCIEIAKETECWYDPGGWGEPFTFCPETDEMHGKVMDLVNTFGLRVVG